MDLELLKGCGLIMIVKNKDQLKLLCKDGDLISVIVPVYNTEKFMCRCIDSIINQTYQNLEIILVDDGSPDNAPAVCDDYKKRYLNIKVIHKANGGLSSARNAGIDICTGKYVSFIDSDDYIDKNMIKRLYTQITKYNADVAMVKYMETSNDDVLEYIEEKNSIVYVNDDIRKAFLTLKIDSVCVGLYSREVIGDARFIEGKTSEDIPFNFTIFNRINTFVYIPEVRYYYFYNPASISNGCMDRNMLNYLAFRKAIRDYFLINENEELVKIANALYVRAAMGLMTRMALYGVSSELDESDLRKLLLDVYKKHYRDFYKESSIPISRKILALIVFNIYSMIKMIGRFRYENFS